MAEISGAIEIRPDKRRGKMTLAVISEGGMEVEHHVPQDKHLLVHAGDLVEAGDPLVDGPLIPHDILRIKGEEALQNYLLGEVQGVYRSQNVGISDKHVEVIVCQMLRKVKVSNPGDSSFLPGEVVDRFRFREENERLGKSYIISNPGDTKLTLNDVVLKADLQEANTEAEEAGGESAKGKRPKPATATTLLLGITKASLSSESFISSASFQETTKVLTEAAIAGAVDDLRGLKENVILGHLIPAGTAYRKYQGMRVKHTGAPIEAPAQMPAEILGGAELAGGLAAAMAAIPAAVGAAIPGGMSDSMPSFATMRAHGEEERSAEDAGNEDAVTEDNRLDQ
jgi:DNA-directed RNA polymerase subunit beta'